MDTRDVRPLSDAEWHSLRSMAQRRPMGPYWPPHVRDRIADVILAGLYSRRAIIRRLGVSNDSLTRWTRARIAHANPSPVSVAQSAPAARGVEDPTAQGSRLEGFSRDVAARLRERAERNERYPWGDPNVTLLGDPPPGRSALDQLRAAQRAHEDNRRASLT